MEICIIIDIIKYILEVIYYIAGIVVAIYAIKQYEQYRKDAYEASKGKVYAYSTMIGGCICLVVENIGNSPVHINKIYFYELNVCGKTEIDSPIIDDKPYILMQGQKLIFNSLKTNLVDNGVSIDVEIQYTESLSKQEIKERFSTYTSSGETNTDKCVCWDATEYTTDGCLYNINNQLKSIDKQFDKMNKQLKEIQ